MKDKIQYGKLLKEYKMERLTQKNDFFGYELPCQNAMGDTQAGEITIGDSEYTAKKFIVGEAIRQFGLIEDVLEKHNIESIESLDLILQGIKKTWQESADAKKELAELKQKAIVPKFNIGAILYMIPTRFNGLTKIKYYKLLSIGLSDIGVRYDMAVNKKESGIEPFYCASEDMFGKSIFATQEEAEQKLAEIKGEKDE